MFSPGEGGRSPTTLAGRIKSLGRPGHVLVLVAVGVFVLVLWRFAYYAPHLGSDGSKDPTQTPDWPLYSNELQHVPPFYSESCFHVDGELDFFELPSLLQKWRSAETAECRDQLRIFDDVFVLESRSGSVEVSNEFRQKVSRWLKNDKRLLGELRHQIVFSLFNRYTHESTLFSKLRSKRPGLVGDGDPKDYAAKLAAEAKGSCDFCQYQKMTAYDSFGRIESTHAVAVSNVFKYEAYHGLILLKKHSPLDYNWEEFSDMMGVLLK